MLSSGFCEILQRFVKNLKKNSSSSAPSRVIPAYFALSAIKRAEVYLGKRLAALLLSFAGGVASG